MKKLCLVLTLVFVLMLTSCSLGKDTPTKTPSNDKEVVSQEKEEMLYEYVLYYPDSQAQTLNPVVKKAIKEKVTDAEFVLTELLKVKGSEDGKYLSVIAPDTRLNSCSVKDGICTVDFNKAFLNIKGTATQKMAVYSVVNTLCNMDSVESVQFLIDGEKVEIFGGYIFDEPFEADLSIIAE